MISSEQQNKLKKKKKYSKDPWDYDKRLNVHVFGVLDREKKMAGMKKQSKEQWASFLGCEVINLQIQETEKTPKKKPKEMKAKEHQNQISKS